MTDVKTAVSEHVLTLTLDRPPVNALTADMMRAITTTLAEVGETFDIRVVLLRGEPGRPFCGGVDLADSARRRRDPSAAQRAVDRLDNGQVVRDLFDALLNCPVPVVAEIGGACVGAGLALVACADVLLASQDARFALPEINAGVLGGARHTQRLVGVFKARSMFFSGDFVPAADFHRLGAVEAVVPPEDLENLAREWCLKLAAKSPIGLRLAKQSLTRIEHLALMEGYRIEQDYTNRLSAFEDSTEAAAAFLERRPPDWKLR